MRRPSKVKIRKVNYITSPIEGRVEQEVRICPECFSILLDGKVICDKCGKYVLPTHD